ncbi:ABC transporter permease [Paraclostridium ghonii]|uniref:ABC transport system permease protein n=1 Tax=Paraclostridium ghonii TaxID=29358 RepID=A0ABU0MZN0_9FIRM|nr:FtsX-like permease family protein [Paeniclostridium ghonii]MDQ0556360.1 putative ABC transport system permease protein [Paeniclostridium ghonii]
MYILKNALSNLTRNKGRNMLIGIIMIAILSCTAISIIINTASNKIIDDYKSRFGSVVGIQSNNEKVQEAIQDGKSSALNEGVPNEMKEKLANSNYLKDTVYNATYPGYSDKIKSLDQDEYEKSKENRGAMPAFGGSDNKSKDAKEPNLSILGGLNPAGREEFEKGTRKIIDGKKPEKNGETMISEDFAKLNNLKVGDSFQVKNPDDPEKTTPLELKVSGIYRDGTKSDNNFGFKMPMLNRKNDIITTFDTLKEYNEKAKKDKDLIDLEAKYILKDPDSLDAFNKEAHEKGLSDLWEISTDAQSYDTMVKPIEGLKGISKLFMFLVLGFGGSILILISILGIRERKYEIGVLRAMGMKKGKVALGLIYETLFMVGISLSIGLGIGSLCAQPITNILLKGQLEAQKEASSNMMTVAMGATSSAPPLEKLNVHLSVEAMVAITLVALLIAVVSVSIGIVYINRYEPRKILTERN